MRDLSSYLRSQDPDHTELLMQMATRYPIPEILNTYADFILDPSNMVTLVDLFNKARVFISFSTILKAVFISDCSPKGSSNQDNLYRFIPTWITCSG